MCGGSGFGHIGCLWDLDSPIVLIHCQDLKKVPRPGGMSWIEAPRLEGAPTVPVLGASTMARTSQGSPSVAVLPPYEGAVLADVDSVGCAGSLSGSRADGPNASGMDVSSTSLTSAVVPFSPTVIRVDVCGVLHPFSMHKSACDDCPCLQLSAFLQGIDGLRGVSPNVQLYSEPWGHVDHSDVNCACLSSDRKAAYVHDLALMPRESLPVSEVEDA